MIRDSFSLLFFIIAMAILPQSTQSQEVSFQRDIRPLLAKNCFACHGPDQEAREADLRLDFRKGAVSQEGRSAAIVVGNPDESELVIRLREKDPDLKMPPPETGHALSAEQIALIELWIRSGAEYSEHWSRIPPELSKLPEVSNPAWPKNPIDHFVMAQWDRRNMSGSTPADRETLIRRLSLDLTGLPPTPEEVDQFVDDPSPNAYETLVDRLLESDRFGEHWARMWLDLARYSDTKGYEKDNPREIWRFRDWVIQAFNQDLPFDQFTIEQIAGDLLDDPTSDQQLATAFHRNTMTNDEGGTDNEEFRVLAVKDRVDTTLQVWMGLTMGCAKCHTHKYDPIQHREYYEFYALFNQTADMDRSDDEPRAATPTESQQKELLTLENSIQSLETAYHQETDELKLAREAWIQDLAKSSVWNKLVPQTTETHSETQLEARPDHSIMAKGVAAEKETYIVTYDDLPEGEFDALRLEALTDPSIQGGGPGRNDRDPNFVLSEIQIDVYTGESREAVRIPIQSAQADFSQSNWPVKNAFDGDQKTGWAISPQKGQPHVAVFRFGMPFQPKKDQRLKITLIQNYGNRLVLGRFRISLAKGTEQVLTPDPQDLGDLARLPENQRTVEQREQLSEAFRRQWPATADQLSQLEGLREKRDRLVKSIPRTPVMKELGPSQNRETRMHLRGNFLQPGEVVQPGILGAFHEFPDGAPMNRLGVAQWLVAAENPLTARVAVNRIWAQLFGRGLVETEEDFGVQGTLPSHPELLDWLAVSYQGEMGWSTKSLCKTIVMSSTYQQSSKTTPRQQQVDPENRWWTRAPRFRLPAETIRDQALQVAGLLSRKIGGPSVMPPQPDGIWQTTYSTLKWKTSEGQDRHRRALYTYWRRTSPYPSMLTFDAGSREVCVIRRIRTNTPLQALVTLNDPVYIEAAAGLAKQMIGNNNAKHKGLDYGFRRVLARAPNEREMSRLEDLLNTSIQDFKNHPEQATALLKAGKVDASKTENPAQFAALMLVSNVLLNLDETLTRN